MLIISISTFNKQRELFFLFNYCKTSTFLELSFNLLTDIQIAFGTKMLTCNDRSQISPLPIPELLFAVVLVNVAFLTQTPITSSKYQGTWIIYTPLPETEFSGRLINSPNSLSQFLKDTGVLQILITNVWGYSLSKTERYMEVVSKRGERSDGPSFSDCSHELNLSFQT